MTDPMELVGRLEGEAGDCPFCGHDPYHYVDNGVGMERVAVTCCDEGIALFQHGDPVLTEQVSLRREAAACIREMVEWRPMSEAPRDGRYILAMMGDAQDRWEHLNGRAFVIRHEGTTDSGYNLGWSVYPGFGGVSDQWFSGWLPLPPAPGAEDE